MNIIERNVVYKQHLRANLREMMKCIRDFVSGLSGRKNSDLTCLKSCGELRGGIWVSKKSLGMSSKNSFDDIFSDLVFLSLFNFPSKLGNEVLFIMHFWGIVPYVVGIFCNCWDFSWR
jgi:hypothetical protein